MKLQHKINNNIISASQEFLDAHSNEYIEYIEIVYVPTLDENKLSKIKELNTKYQDDYNTYLSKYPQAEIDTFNDKKKEALAYQLDNTVQTPIIDDIVSTLGGTKDDYILSILSKVSQIAQNEGNLVKTRDAIKACTTQDELDAIVI